MIPQGATWPDQDGLHGAASCVQSNPDERPLSSTSNSKPPDRFREEFRTPSGVGKSPRNEPAVCRVWVSAEI